jgi:hypothetical protein
LDSEELAVEGIERVMAIFAKLKGWRLVEVHKQGAQIDFGEDEKDHPRFIEETRVVLSFKDDASGKVRDAVIVFEPDDGVIGVRGFLEYD